MKTWAHGILTVEDVHFWKANKPERQVSAQSHVMVSLGPRGTCKRPDVARVVLVTCVLPPCRAHRSCPHLLMSSCPSFHRYWGSPGCPSGSGPLPVCLGLLLMSRLAALSTLGIYCLFKNLWNYNVSGTRVLWRQAPCCLMDGERKCVEGTRAVVPRMHDKYAHHGAELDIEGE